MSLFVAAYDISSDFARDRVAQVLLEYGQRLQDSVFLIWIEPEELPTLRRELGALLARQDRFDLLPVDEAPHRSRWSWQRPPDAFCPVIMG
jgi:CRISPR-associated endonuclease Cas2